MSSALTWRNPAELMPDEGSEVLVALSDGTVTGGWNEGSRWLLDAHLSFPVAPTDERGLRVMAWAEMPDHPFPDEIEPGGWFPGGKEAGR